MGGHICVDAAQGGLASVLPFLVIQSGFSYTEITALVLASNIASAVIQPCSVSWATKGASVAHVGRRGACGLGHRAGGRSAVVLAGGFGGNGFGGRQCMLHPEGARLAYLAAATTKP